MKILKLLLIFLLLASPVRAQTAQETIYGKVKVIPYADSTTVLRVVDKDDNILFLIDTTNDRVVIGGGTAGVDYSVFFDGETNDGLYTWMEDEDYFDFADVIKLPYLGAAPATLTNGLVWMESDGLHIYYNGAEKIVAGI